MNESLGGSLTLSIRNSENNRKRMLFFLHVGRVQLKIRRTTQFFLRHSRNCLKILKLIVPIILKTYEVD